jgi:curved DNA-binding protein CbpA
VDETSNGCAGFRDYYEILQLSPNADTETVDRVYRILVKRYHPDNQATGNEARFNDVVEAHRVLADLERRAAYDVKYDENRGTVVNVFERVSSGDGFGDDKRLFDGVLSLLYVARRRDPNHGGLGIVQIERLLGCPAEHLEFHLWYLRQKGWIERLDSGLFAITVAGIDRVVESDALLLRRDRLLKPGPDGSGPPDSGPPGPSGARGP